MKILIIRYVGVLLVALLMSLVSCTEEPLLQNTEITVNETSLDLTVITWVGQGFSTKEPYSSVLIESMDSLVVEDYFQGRPRNGSLTGIDSVWFVFADEKKLSFSHDYGLMPDNRNPLWLRDEELTGTSNPFFFRHVITEEDYLRAE
ncbi:MAG: hypothetical protein ACJAZM_002094 [Cyclobacteriaceae bacterium]|jgi:hypothetical protein